MSCECYIIARIELLSWLAISNEVRAIGVFRDFYSTGEAEVDTCTYGIWGVARE